MRKFEDLEILGFSFQDFNNDNQITITTTTTVYYKYRIQ
jgi:hypothetical protein